MKGCANIISDIMGWINDFYELFEGYENCLN